jgi:hypothetical protein
VSVTSPDTIADIMGTIDTFFVGNPKLTKKVDVFVNYDGFDCREELVADFTEQARRLEAKYYRSVRRISSAGFARHKLADSMQMTLQESYSFDEVFELLKSMSFSVSRETAFTLCSRFDKEDKRGVISSEELESIIAILKTVT